MLIKLKKNLKTRRYRRDNISELNLNFLQKLHLDEQFLKLKNLLNTEQVDDYSLSSLIPSAETLNLEDTLQCEIYSTGIKEFDMMLRLKGIESGNIIEFCGQSQSGKSLMIHTILSNVLRNQKDIEVLYFDSKQIFQGRMFMELLQSQGIPKDEATNIVKRIGVVQITTIHDLLDGLQQLLLNRRNNKIKFIVINTITIPYYHNSASIILTKKITADLHKAIHQLAKRNGITFLIGNLGLHKYKISESDKDDDQSSVTSSKSQLGTVSIDDVKAALDEYWPQVLDHRFVITSINNKCDVLGFVEILREITMVESRYEKVGKSIIVKINEMGIV